MEEVTLYTYEIVFQRYDTSIGVYTTRAEDEDHAVEKFTRRYPDCSVEDVICYGEV